MVLFSNPFFCFMFAEYPNKVSNPLLAWIIRPLLLVDTTAWGDPVKQLLEPGPRLLQDLHHFINPGRNHTGI